MGTVRDDGCLTTLEPMYDEDDGAALLVVTRVRISKELIEKVLECW